jgi:phage repressor protein C with HTH and peptisase S24 domain
MSIDLIEIGKRIREVRGKRTGIEFGKILGVGNNMVSVYESGQSFPKTQTLDTIIQLSGRPADWLLYGKGEDGPVVISEPQGECTATMLVRALAGAGNPCCIDQLEPIGQIIVQKNYNGPNIQVVQIRGTSMEPTIMNGAHVGVDVTAKEIVSGQMYAVYIPHEGIVVKRIWIGPELVKIASDNPTAPDHDMLSERINWDSFVQGRVKWVIQEY